jgi:dienelactone hydrolase
LIDVYHLGGAAVFTPFSNFSGKGPVKVGTLPGITTYGALDMAGNVREWCWNETPKGRLVRGGAWDDNSYMFGNLSQAPPMDRSAKNGFRCALYPDAAKVPATALAPVTFGASTDFYKQPAVSDEIFRVYKEQFFYDKTELRPQVDSRQEQASGWVHETITFDAAYGRERVTAHLFLPRNVTAPYQTVIYFPGSAAVTRTTSQGIEDYYEFTMFLSFLVKNGRAVLFPVYKGTFERSDPALAAIHGGNETRAFTEFLTQLVKDLSRSIDYLETRKDIDTSKLAFYGMSWGGAVGPIATAVEPRLATSVLLGGSLSGRGRPEANGINYITRVQVPTLMLNGKYDSELDTNVKPLFDLLGTKNKKLVLDDTDHIPTTNMFIREILAWLDRELGPVKR